VVAFGCLLCLIVAKWVQNRYRPHSPQLLRLKYVYELVCAVWERHWGTLEGRKLNGTV